MTLPPDDVRYASAPEPQAGLGDEDVEDLIAIVRSGREAPAFYKAGYSWNRASRLAAGILRRHAYGVAYDDRAGTVEVEVPERPA